MDHSHNIRQSSNVINLNEAWNIKIVMYLKTIGEKSMGYRWMHDQEMIHYVKWEKILRVLNVILLSLIVGLTGSQFIVSLSSDTDSKNKALYISLNLIIIVFVIIQGIVTGILDLKNYNQLIFDHRWTSVKFNEIYFDILSQLSLSVSKREKDEDYIRNKTKEFNDNIITAPPIRQSTIRRYSKESSDNVNRPIQISGFDKIEVIVDIPCDYEEHANKTSTEEIKNNLSEKINMEIDRWIKGNLG